MDDLSFSAGEEDGVDGGLIGNQKGSCGLMEVHPKHLKPRVEVEDQFRVRTCQVTNKKLSETSTGKELIECPPKRMT